MKRHFSVLFSLSLVALFLASTMLSSGAATGLSVAAEEFIKKYRRVAARGDYQRQLLLRENGSHLDKSQLKVTKEANDKAWLLAPEVFDNLNPAAQRAALRSNNLLEKPQRSERDRDRRLEAEPHLSPGDNMRVNDPSQDEDGRTQSETSIAVSGNNLVIAFNDASDNGAGYAFSTDSGNSFTHKRIPTPTNGFNLGDGVVAYGANGELYHSGLSEAANGREFVGVAKSTNNGASFTAPADASVSVSNPLDFQDKPWMTVDRNANSPFKGNIYVSWSQFTIDDDLFILVSRSTNGGNSFEPAVKVSQPDGFFFVQGSMPAVAPNGDVYVAYADAHPPNTQGGLSIVKSTNGGATFSAPKPIVGFNFLRTMTGGSNCRTNSFPSIAVDNNNNVHIVYAGIAVIPGADRGDVFHIRSTDGGATFSSPVKLNDDNGSASQLFPFIAVAGNNTIGVKWWDRRNDPVNDALTDVYMTLSTNGGASFSKNSRVTNHNWALGAVEPGFASGYHGDYDAMVADNNNFYIGWSDERGDNPDIYLAQVPVNQNPLAADFNISVRQTTNGVIAGRSADYTLDTSGSNGFASTLALGSFAAISGATYGFSSASVAAGQQAKVTLAVSGATAPGNYVTAVTAGNGATTRRTTFRATVYSATRTEGVPINASNTSGFTSAANPVIDAGGTLHLAYDDDTGVGAGSRAINVFYTRSSDGGKTFAPGVKVNGNFPIAVSPYLAVGPTGTIFVSWVGLSNTNQLGAFVARSTDGGNSFSAPTLYSLNGHLPDFPNLALGPNNAVFAVYTDTPADNIWRLFVARSTDGGATFGTPIQASGNNDDLSFPGYVAVDGNGKVYAVFNNLDFIGASTGVKLATATSGGQPFSAPALLSQSGTPSFGPHLTIDGSNNLYVTFYSRLGSSSEGFNREVILLKSTDGGTTFSSPRNLSNNGGQSVNPFVITGANGSVGVAWHDTSGNEQFDIFLARSSDNGATFTAASNVSANFGISALAYGAADKDGKLFLSWTDDSPANTEAMVMAVTPASTGEPPPTPDFALAFDPPSVTVEPGKTNITVNINRSGGFTGSINIPAPDPGSGKIKVSPEAVDTTEGSARFKFKVKGAAPKGARQIVFTGRDSTGRTRSATLTLVVQ